MREVLDDLGSADAAPSSGHPGAGSAAVWAARITECWRSSVESIIRAGRLLIEAKADLPFGEFGAMCARDLPFGERTAQRLMAIAEDKRLSNPTHVSLLPASYSTLAELTKLTDYEFSSAVEQKIISPDMIRADVDQIRALARPHESQAKEPEAGGGLCGEASHAVRVGEASADLPATSEHMDVTAGETAPHSAPMPSGGLAVAHQRVEPRDSLDFFPTPPWATRTLIEHVFAHLERKGHCQFQTAWEPACGEGHMAEPLRDYFRHVVATDIEDYGYGDYQQDFLSAQIANSADWIITNPPFNTSTEFVLKALHLAGTGVAMFVRLTWLESVGRYEKIFRDHPPTLIAIFSERVPLHKGRWESDGATMSAYIWLVWIKGAPPRTPFWIPPGCRDQLTRAGDIKRFGKSPGDEAVA